MQKPHRPFGAQSEQECLCYLCDILPDHGREKEKFKKARETETVKGGDRNYREEAW
jgi:hypothetical protein